MTAILAWSTHDGKPGAASLYLASDSRLCSKLGENRYRVLGDEYQKVFAAEGSPDVFAICGAVAGARDLVIRLMSFAPLVREELSEVENPATGFTERLFGRVLSEGSHALSKNLMVFHAFRFDRRNFGLTKVRFVSSSRPEFTRVQLRDGGGILSRDGLGEEMVRKTQLEYCDLEAESKGYSRWLWMSFHASLSEGSEVTCGGAPQLVGLYGRHGGQILGVRFKGEAFVEGKRSERDDIEYRDELFQRVDAAGNLLPGAQPHARMGRTRIFNFAP